MKYLTTLFAAIIVVSGAQFASALEVGAGGSMNADVSVGSGASAAADRSAEAAMNAGVDASIDVGVSGSGSASGSSSSAESGAEASGSSGMSVEIASPIVITRKDVEASAEADGTAAGQAMVDSPASVRTGADLSAYAKTVVKSDTHVEDARFASDTVSIAYKQRAKLFGFIPVLVRATATVRADGTATVSYPWYAIFAATDSSLETDVRGAVASELAAGGADASANAEARFTAEQQARILAKMHQIMKSHLDASASAAAEGSASAGY